MLFVSAVERILLTLKIAIVILGQPRKRKRDVLIDNYIGQSVLDHFTKSVENECVLY